MAGRARPGSRICPRCGSVDTMPIRTGWPEPEIGQVSLPTQPRLRGTLGIDNPDRVCRKCGLQWSTLTRK